MSLTLACVALPVCLVGLVAGSIWLDRGLEAMGNRLHLLPALLGLISAFGADSPQITSAISASLEGRHQTGVGVVVWSNIFNIAGLTGLSGQQDAEQAIRSTWSFASACLRWCSECQELRLPTLNCVGCSRSLSWFPVLRALQARLVRWMGGVISVIIASYL